MNNRDIEYIQPNQIGYTEISEEERKIILKAERDDISKLFAVLIAIVIIGIGIIIIKIEMETVVEVGETALTFIATGLSWLSILLTKTKIKFTASAHGTIIQKDIIKQKVIAGRNYRYRKYFLETPHTDKPTVEQDFYYLTVKLANGRYVRYVNCLREDFISVSEGDKVLAVCYGFNEIKGYVI
ncbi:MAG: hypothetical protein K2O60_03900 [Ruminococcus sp.]|nr:hypothetical protein [Ruminococcus sp.]